MTLNEVDFEIGMGKHLCNGASTNTLLSRGKRGILLQTTPGREEEDDSSTAQTQPVFRGRDRATCLLFPLGLLVVVVLSCACGTGG
jgi:hypothetical protein